ncbi:MAG: protein kinase [Cyanobacteria bacterium CRU_2_1]|nr:protein kinase [Cyanobacteria bacterium RU_5_0]NJR62328.1 protein kinase [Cyanobacteria bacterium CRU_2_1]
MIGQLLKERYQIINALGAGGMGQTYVAEDMHRPHHPKCVVKHLKPASEAPHILTVARRLFATEAEILEELGNHDQIPRLLAYFEQNQEFYLVQEFIDGTTLLAEFRLSQPWVESRLIYLLDEILSILEFVHHRNVIHRDIKPGNLIRRQSDGKLVLIDFGSVKQVRLYQPMIAGQANLTVAIGTPGYMPIEQSSGKPRPSSDIYAVGMVGIQALTGLSPARLWEDEDGEVLWRDQVEVSDELAAILTKMIRPYFRERYQTASEALVDLRRLRSSAIPPTVVPLGPSSDQIPPEIATDLPTRLASPSQFLTHQATMETAPTQLVAPSFNPSQTEQPSYPAVAPSTDRTSRTRWLLGGIAALFAVGGIVAYGLVFLSSQKAPIATPPSVPPSAEPSPNATPNPASPRSVASPTPTLAAPSTPEPTPVPSQPDSAPDSVLDSVSEPTSVPDPNPYVPPDPEPLYSPDPEPYSLPEPEPIPYSPPEPERPTTAPSSPESDPPPVFIPIEDF